MVIESPSFGTPTPTNGAPPLIELVVVNPLVAPGVLLIDPAAPELPELSGVPKVPDPFVAPAGELPPPSVGKPVLPAAPPAPGEAPNPPGDEDPNPLDPGEEAPNALDPGDEDPYAEPV
jgi:hypothetical protein